MLNRKELLENVDEKYALMLEKVNIANFTKCVAVFSALPIEEVSDTMIKKYLVTWAENKYRLFELFGKKLTINFQINYEDPMARENIVNKYREICMTYPVHALWLQMFMRCNENIIRDNWISYSDTDIIQTLFPGKKIIDTLPITKFFKQYLDASDELVTEIGRIYENKKVSGNFVWSIDPVDMMLASITPYNWSSCYNIKNGGYASGCMAAVVDENSTISYISDKVGDLKLEEYCLKNVAYKKIRMWVDIHKEFESLVFHDTYPCRNAEDSFKATLRDAIETYIADAKGVRNLWKTPENVCSLYSRTFEYGYDESGGASYYILKSALEAGKDESEFVVPIYTNTFECACGCGFVIPDRIGEDERYERDEDGYNCQIIYENYYCDDCGEWYHGDYCSCHEVWCDNCDEYYNDEEHDCCPYCHGENDNDED